MTPITTKNITRHELIGLKVEMIQTRNSCETLIRGKVVDESRNTLLILNGEQKKKIEKRNAVFRFNLPDGTAVEVDGQILVGRPEDRVKKKIKRSW